MPHPFPHHYEVALSWEQGDQSAITAGARPSIGGGSPPEFDGTDPTRWSPEHLILAALSQCLLLTWISLNKRAAIPLKGWEATGASTLDKTQEGLIFTEFRLKINLKVPAERVDEARKQLETAKKYCIVANALKTPVSLDASVEAA
ncbi:MAG: OsmC family protein [Elusimicrobiota bacterium]